MAGVDEGTKFSNIPELSALFVGTNNITFHSFETCQDKKDNLIGIRFTVLNQLGLEVEMNALGEMSGICHSL